MAYRVRIDSFEGPFDLLLYLVSRQKIDVETISLSEIADQYWAEVGRIKNIDLDVASDFLLVASTLLEIKAQSLLPQNGCDTQREVQELSADEMRDMLVERLCTYKQYKNAAAMLQARFVSEGRMHTRPFGPDAHFAKLMPDFLQDITLDKLASLALKALARREVFLLEAQHIAAVPIPIETYVRSIYSCIQKRKTLQFCELVDKNTPADVAVATFLALLELYKRSVVKLEQPEQFGDIAIRYIEGSGDMISASDEDLAWTKKG